MKKIRIHTDGACIGNPGPGGWAAILQFNDDHKPISGGEKNTTNNRMELMAAIEGLRALTEPCEVELYTDSSYLKNGITSWIKGWKKNGWKTANKKPVKNKDLWQDLDELAGRHKVSWHWVKGHAGDPLNEECDRLATGEARKREF